MRCSARLIGILLSACATPALAQTTTATGGRIGGPGVDIAAPVYTRPFTTQVTNPSTAALSAPLTGAAGAPAGIPAGNIILYPSLTGGAFYDDNVFASTSTTGRLGLFRAAGARLPLQQLANAELAGAAFVEKRWYDTFNSEDQVNAGAALGGTVQPNANTQLVGRAAIPARPRGPRHQRSDLQRLHQAAGYDQFEAAGAINQRYGRLWTSVGAAGAWIHYDTPTHRLGCRSARPIATARSTACRAGSAMWSRR